MGSVQFCPQYFQTLIEQPLKALPEWGNREAGYWVENGVENLRSVRPSEPNGRRARGGVLAQAQAKRAHPDFHRWCLLSIGTLGWTDAPRMGETGPPSTKKLLSPAPTRLENTKNAPWGTGEYRPKHTSEGPQWVRDRPRGTQR